MATQEELLKQYEDDKRRKIFKLQSSLSTRVSTDAKSKARVESNGVSIIKGVDTISDLIRGVENYQDELYSLSSLENFSEAFNTVKSVVIQQRTTQEEAFGFVLISCFCELRETGNIGVAIGESLILKRPGKTSASSIYTIPPTSTSFSANSFEELNQQLSGISYPTRNLTVNEKFFMYLEDLADALNSTAGGPIIDRIPIACHSVFNLGDFNKFFPKPEGLVQIPSSVSSISGTSGTSGTSGVTPPQPPSVPTGTGGVTPPQPPSVPTGTDSVTPPQPPSTTNVDGATTPTNNSTSGTSGTSGVRKFLSIEAIKDDDVLLRARTSGTSGTSGRKFVSGRILQDDDKLLFNRTDRERVRATTEQKDLENVRTETDTSVPKNELGQTEKTEKNNTNNSVKERETQEANKKTEAQKRGEEADSLAKEEVKEKGKGEPVGAKTAEGKKTEEEKKSQPIPENKKPEPKQPKSSKALSFSEWRNKKENQVESGGLIYRGEGIVEYKPSNTPIRNIPIEKGKVGTKQYKIQHNFGKNFDSIFAGYSPIQSPIDLALLMNATNVGRFNKNWGHTFGEGSEIHLAMISNNSRHPSYDIERKTEGGIGDNVIAPEEKEPYLEVNWAQRPYWCGLFVDFLLFSNGKNYKSDPDEKTIVGTSDVIKYFQSSPFNPENVEANKKRSIAEKQRKINEANDNKNGLETKISKEEKNISNYESSIKRDEAEIKTQEKNINDANQEIAVANADTTNPDRKKIREATSKKQNAETRKKSLETSVARNNTNLNTSKNLITGYEQQIALINSEIENLQKEKDLIEKTPLQKYITTNTVAKFEKGKHFDNQYNLTSEGESLVNAIREWPGAYIVRLGSGGGHVELLLHWSVNDNIYFLGGNTTIWSKIDPQTGRPTEKNAANRNGNGFGFAKRTLKEFAEGASLVFVVKRGESSRYSNGIGISLKKTTLWEKYVNELDADNELSSDAYNILRNIMGV